MTQQRLKHWISGSLIVSAVLSAPVVLATYLVNAASGASEIPIAARSSQEQKSPERAPVVPLVAGVLYTNGPVKVNWHGVPIRVDSSSYAYTGGELVTTAPNAMGILRLRGGSTIFICPGSRVRVSHSSTGGYVLNIVDGSSRFMFDANTPFAVRLNDIVMTPGTAAPPPQDAAQTSMFVGEAQAEKDGGCLLCALQNGMWVSAPGLTQGTQQSVAAGAGQIIAVPGPQKRGKTTTTALTGSPTRDGDASGVTTIEIPQDLVSTMTAGVGPDGGGVRGIGYLCKCRKLKEYAELAAQAGGAAERSDASGDHDALQVDAAAPAGPAGSSTPAVPDPAPAVTPPAIPGLVVAESGPPDPFVPGLIPAAGDGSAPGDPPPVLDTPIIVPPPLIPGSGPGGGGVVSPS